MRRLSALGVAAVATILPATAVAAETPEPAPPPHDQAPSPPARRPEIGLAFGVRGTVVRSAGLDPYANNDFLAQMSFAGGVTIFRAGSVSLFAFAGWDFGGKSAYARGNDARIAVHRLSAGVESRLELGRRFYFFAKLAPAALHLRGSITDAAVDRPLVARTWTWALDTTGGAAVAFAIVGSKEAPSARFWFTGELGYSFAGTASMAYAPVEDEEDPRRFGSVMLPALRPGGPVGRLGVAVTF
jgi:hypothetical protein